MKLFGLLASSALLLTSVSVQAAENSAETGQPQAAGMEAMMLQMAKQQALKTCSDKEMLSCLEVSEADCKNMMNGVIDKCMAPNLSTLMASQGMEPAEREALNKKMEQCADSVAEENGIDREKAKSCSPKQQ